MMISNDAEKSAESWQVPEYQELFWLGCSREYCVVIPVINEGVRILNLLRRMSELGIHEAADIIIVDGGSKDGSLEEQMLQSLGVRGLLLKTGPGRLSAQLRCAYAFSMLAGYLGVVTIDGNDKDDPKDIPHFLAELKNGVDFVQASRFIRGGVAENTPLVRHIAIRMIHAPVLSLCSGFRWTDTTQGFRAYSRQVLLDPRVAPFRDVFANYELLAYLSYRVPRLGYRCKELPTVRRYPKGEVPTKISGLAGNLELISVLAKSCMGAYNPDSARG